MGWTTNLLPYGRKMTDELKRMFTWESETHTHRVLASSLVKWHTWYAAVERVEKGSNSRKVLAVVTLVHNHPRSGEWRYKDMTEEAGPCNRECPEKILKLLTATTNQYATQWRKDCWARIKNKKKKKPLKTGYHLVLEKPLSFTNGADKNVFYIEDAKRRIFLANDGYRYKLGRNPFQSMNYDVVKFNGVPKEDLPTLIGISQAVGQEVNRRLSEETH